MPKKATSPKLERAARKLLDGSTYGKTGPAVEPWANFAHTTVVFLKDFRDDRLTAGEVCDTLLAAALARNFIKPVLKSLADEELANLLNTTRKEQP